MSRFAQFRKLELYETGNVETILQEVINQFLIDIDFVAAVTCINYRRYLLQYYFAICLKVY